jgi:hypothetical protein
MRESRTYGSVRGARGNSRPYREACVLLHLLTAGFGTTRPKRDVRDDGESWGVSGRQPSPEPSPVPYGTVQTVLNLIFCT